MKIFCVCTLIVLVAVNSGDAYSTVNDNFSIEELVTDASALKKFVGCFIDKEDCNEVQTGFKKDMPDAVETGCTKCNDRQKHMFKVFLDALKEKLPVEYKEYQNKFDPEDKHFSTFLDNVAKY